MKFGDMKFGDMNRSVNASEESLSGFRLFRGAGRFWAALPLLLIALLAACAPRASGGETFAAAFSQSGVIWTANGQTSLARAPQFLIEPVRTPGRVADVAWQGGDAWVALPEVGWVQRVTGAPGVVRAGRAVKLSAERIYREDGSAVSYAGLPATGLIGAPDAVVTGGDGLEYALQGAKLYRLDAGRTLLRDPAGGPYLLATPDGAATSAVPAAVRDGDLYRLTNGQLERVDAAGAVRAAVPHPPGLIGLTGDLIATISPGGRLRLFRSDLSEVKR